MSGTNNLFGALSDKYDMLYLGDPAYVCALETIVREVCAYRPKRILELGVGTGNLASIILDRLKPDDYVALDCSSEMLEQAKRKLGVVNSVRYAEEKIEEYVIEPGTDCIVTNYTLHHLIDEEKLIFCKRLHECLAEDGIFIYGDVFVGIDAVVDDAARCRNIVEIFGYRALYYLQHVGFAKMVLEIEHMPYILRHEREMLVTSSFWVDGLTRAGFADVDVIMTSDEMPCDRVIVAKKHR